MRLSYFALALLPVALASPFELVARADASAAVLSGLKLEDKDGKTLNATVNTFPASGPYSSQLGKLNTQTTKLNKDIQKTTKSAKGSSAFSQSGSAAIADYVTGTLTPDVTSILDNIIAHYDGFKTKGYTGLVKASLVQQEKLVKAQAAAITAKLAQPYKGQSPAATKVITDKYDEAIAKFSK